jgi:hypothetical protein
MQTLLDNEFATASFDEETKIVQHVIKKPIRGQPLRDILNAGATAMELHLAKKWFSDDRNNGALPEEDEKWSATNWVPRVVKAGWKYWAVVQPVKAIGQLNIQHFVELFASFGVTVRVFTDPDEAMTWLKAQ